MEKRIEQLRFKLAEIMTEKIVLATYVYNFIPQNDCESAIREVVLDLLGTQLEELGELMRIADGESFGVFL